MQGVEGRGSCPRTGDRRQAAQGDQDEVIMVMLMMLIKHALIRYDMI